MVYGQNIYCYSGFVALWRLKYPTCNVQCCVLTQYVEHYARLALIPVTMTVAVVTMMLIMMITNSDGNCDDETMLPYHMF